MKKGDIVKEFNPMLLQSYDVVVAYAWGDYIEVSSGRRYRLNAKGVWSQEDPLYKDKPFTIS